ncbi:hypothetical protein [Streptomyces sp. NPDC001070]
MKRRKSRYAGRSQPGRPVGGCPTATRGASRRTAREEAITIEGLAAGDTLHRVQET